MSDRAQQALAAAIDALGDIMLEMQRRRLLDQARSDRARRFIERTRPAMTDEQVGALAASAFEAGALVLAELRHPGAPVFRCDPGGGEP